MIKWYNKLKSEQKDLFIIVLIALVVFLCLLPLYLIKQGAWPNGWLLGSAVAVVGYVTLVKTLSKFGADSQKASSVGLTILFSALRYVLYAAALAVSAVCTFRPDWFGGFNGFQFFATALALIPTWGVLLVANFVRAKKEEKSSGNPS
jgi:hypothetical protein